MTSHAAIVYSAGPHYSKSLASRLGQNMRFRWIFRFLWKVQVHVTFHWNRIPDFCETNALQVEVTKETDPSKVPVRFLRTERSLSRFYTVQRLMTAANCIISPSKNIFMEPTTPNIEKTKAEWPIHVGVANYCFPLDSWSIDWSTCVFDWTT